MPITAPLPHKVDRDDYDAVENELNSATSNISALTSIVNTKAPLASPTFTGTVTLPSNIVIPNGSLSIEDTSGLQSALDSLPTGVKAVLSATQTNTTVTPAVLTGHTFVVPPGKTLNITSILIATAAATGTGIALGVRVSQPSGASGAAIGSWRGTVHLSSTASATGLSDGDSWNVAANSNVLGEILGTATTAGNNPATIDAIVFNTASAHSTTVTVEFRSEVGGSAVVAQIGTATAGTIL